MEQRRERVELARALEEVRQLQDAATTLATAVAKNRTEIQEAEIKSRTAIHEAEVRTKRIIFWVVGSQAVLFVVLFGMALWIAGNVTRSLREAIMDGHGIIECLVSRPEAERLTTKTANECRQVADANKN